MNRSIRLMHVLLWFGILMAGCAHTPAPIATTRPAMMLADWTFDGRPARLVQTDHYIVHTTIDDEVFQKTIGLLMEGALKEYEAIVPGLPESSRAMECYLFAKRTEWAQFTKDHTGDDAAVYLQINRGGYTVNDWFAAQFTGDRSTFAVASHEGWHQFVARHFKCRMPPFLEEGIATMFENVRIVGGTPQWNVATNPLRADRLRVALEDGQMWPLEQLCTMHAGDVVGLSGERIETFYAQNWAFAQFLMNAENHRYRPAFQRMMTELAVGSAEQWTGHRRILPTSWDPRSVRPLLEHYLAMNMKQIDAAYRAYVRQIAFSNRVLN